MPEHTPAPTPSRAVYGFALYLSFKLFFLIYLIWALLPENWFRAIGITCLPQRIWAVVVPVFLIFGLVLFASVIYPTMGLLMTPTPDDLRTVTSNTANKSAKDGCTQRRKHQMTKCNCVAPEMCKSVGYDYEDFNQKSIPALRDLDIGEVSEKLYLK